MNLRDTTPPVYLLGRPFMKQDVVYALLLCIPPLFASIAAVGYSTWDYYHTQAQLTADNQTLEAARAKERELVDMRSVLTQANSTIQDLRMHRAAAFQPFLKLRALANGLPTSVRLTEVDVSGATLSLTGEAMQPTDLIAARQRLPQLSVSSVSNSKTNAAFTWSGVYR